MVIIATGHFNSALTCEMARGRSKLPAGVEEALLRVRIRFGIRLKRREGQGGDFQGSMVRLLCDIQVRR